MRARGRKEKRPFQRVLDALQEHGGRPRLWTPVIAVAVSPGQRPHGSRLPGKGKKPHVVGGWGGAAPGPRVTTAPLQQVEVLVPLQGPSRLTSPHWSRGGGEACWGLVSARTWGTSSGGAVLHGLRFLDCKWTEMKKHL